MPSIVLYHPFLMDKIRLQLNLEDKFDSALDVACGTGLSTVALKLLADNISGMDSSEEMIVANAHNNEQITYHHAPAERLPFSNDSFDLSQCAEPSIGLIEQDSFLKQKRVLKKQGWVILYDNFITEHMRENTAYTQAK